MLSARLANAFPGAAVLGGNLLKARGVQSRDEKAVHQGGVSSVGTIRCHRPTLTVVAHLAQPSLLL